MTEKTVYRISEVMGKGRRRWGRLAIIDFAKMTNEEQRVELEAVRSKLAAGEGEKLLAFLEEIIALDPNRRKDLVSRLSEDLIQDTLSGRV